MKPYTHAKTDVKAYGGKPEDYLPLHNFMDSSKAHMPDNRHRCVLHSSFGIFILEKVFGEVFLNSDGKEISVRDIGERHVTQDLGLIPTLQDYLENMDLKEWMIQRSKDSYPSSRKKIIKNKEEFNLIKD